MLRSTISSRPANPIRRRCSRRSSASVTARRLFYGGYLSWQRFGDFATDQGAEEVYGAPHMSKGVATHEWGVDDEYLLDFIADTVDDSRPSFNLIMTTSYHPPYNVDVWGKGFPLEAGPARYRSDVRQHHEPQDARPLMVLGQMPRRFCEEDRRQTAPPALCLHRRPFRPQVHQCESGILRALRGAPHPVRQGRAQRDQLCRRALRAPISISDPRSSSSLPQKGSRTIRSGRTFLPRGKNF